MKSIWTEAKPKWGYSNMWPSDAEYRALRVAKNMALAGNTHDFCACGKNCQCAPGFATQVIGETYNCGAITKWAWVDRARNSYGFVSAIYVNDCAATGTGSGLQEYLIKWDGVPLRADTQTGIAEPMQVVYQRRIFQHRAPDLHINAPAKG